MPPVLRSVLAVLAGLVVGSAVNMGLLWVNSLIFPLPAGVDGTDPAALSAALAKAPPTAWVLILLAHGGNALVGAWLAAKLAGRAPLVHGLTVGALVLCGGIANLRSIPAPLWVAVVDLALYLPAAWLGAKLAAPRPPDGAPSSAQPAAPGPVTLRP